MKQLIAGTASALLFVAMSLPAFAHSRSTLEVNRAHVDKTITVESVTGLNIQGNPIGVTRARVDDISATGGTNSMVTGDSHSRLTDVTIANTSASLGETRSPSRKITRAHVDETITANAYTGSNVQGNSVTVDHASADDLYTNGSNGMTTGTATSTVDTWTVVNTQIGVNLGR